MQRITRYSLFTLVACIGCGGPSYDATVQGTVTIDGVLAERGRVVFNPVGEGPSAYGNIFSNGSYSMRVGQGDLSDVDGGGLKAGEYIVTVVVNMPSVPDDTVGEGGAPKPGARLTATKYADKSTSDMRVTVKPGPNVVPLELEGVTTEVEASDAAGSPPPPTDGAAMPSMGSTTEGSAK